MRGSCGVLAAGWTLALVAAIGARAYNALAGPLMWGYDAWGHVAYVLFLDAYGGVPWADQGWSYYQPPLHYVLAWPLARLGSAEVLVRGLSLLGGAASLAVAGLAARLAHVLHPERPGLALVAFCAVAFLPVHLAVGNMPGNEMTLACLVTLAMWAWIANERRPLPRLRGDALTGALLGLALLAKHTGFVAVAALTTALVLGAALAPDRRAARRRVALRGRVLLAALLLVAGFHYVRNVESTGKLIPTNRDNPMVAGVEAGQPPGVRRVRDYLTLSPRMLASPNPLAPHMLRSIWSSLYTNVWADTHRESDSERALSAESAVPRGFVAMMWLGLLPTGLALAGAGLALRDVWADRRRSVYLPLLALCAWMGLGFAVFTWIVPRWSAVKASYCLSLSLPFALFLVRGLEPLRRRGSRALQGGVAAWLLVTAVASTAVGAMGLVLPRRHDAPASGAVRFYFGEYEAARRVYARLATGAPYPVPWLDNLGAVELAQGRPERARRLYARAVDVERKHGPGDPYRSGQLAVAQAVAGDLEAALALLDAILARRDLPELRANRGAVRAAAGDLSGARTDLREALEREPALVPARLNLARVAERLGAAAEAGRAFERAARDACATPRRFPYAVGTGEVLEWGIGRRWLLLLEGDRTLPALPAFYREACQDLRAELPTRSRTGSDGGAS